MQVSGADEFARVSAVLREAGDKRLQGELRRAGVRSGRHVEQAVRGRVGSYMPSGFAPVLSSALQAKTQIRSVGRDTRVTVVFHADGAAGNRRKIDKMERGLLEHPVWGRSRRARRLGRRIPNQWVTQRIRPGFVTEPGNAALPQARDEFQQAVGRVADHIRRAV